MLFYGSFVQAATFIDPIGNQEYVRGSSYATAFITRDIAKLIATGTLITNVKSSFVSSTSSVGGKRYYNPPSTM